MKSLFDAAGGQAGLTRLAHAWHVRCLADPIVEHAFSHGFREDHSERLAAYWAQALGGPTDYTDTYGSESDVVRMHAGNGEHPEMDAAAIACFAAALDDVGLEGRTAEALLAYFTWSTVGPMDAYPDAVDDVPEGLALPRWGWGGPETS